ncbi:MAG TPA: hypothetical protein VFN18_12015 [Solirubrobacterales bacterium]|nr:hypothetical protein [Solirubrobacterales bacterium]
MPRRPLDLHEAIRYFHGARRASAAIRARQEEQGSDASAAAEMEQLVSSYREALERTADLQVRS